MPRFNARRRDLLKGGLLATAGTALGNFFRLQAVAAGRRPPTADSCILVFLNGGMSHLDTFDPKPDQPAEIRGEFSPIPTTAPGVRVTEHLPRLARQAHRYAVVCTVTFEGRLGNHSPACYHMLTGQEPQGEAAVLAPPTRSDHPTMGSAAARLRPTPGTVPAFVMAPDVLIENAHLTPGQFAGWLGSRYEAFNLRADPSRPGFAVPALARPADVPAKRLASRRELLARLDAGRPDLAASLAGRELGPHYERAFDLLTGTRARAAFDLTTEPSAVRERYGVNPFGQSILLARRLVEAGVRFVNVHWPNVGGGANWDTHSNGFARLKNVLLPPFDRALSALLDDLADRGLLGRTLVVVLTEFGRAPQIGKTFQNSGGPAGRDHWSSCFSVLLGGGGVRGGQTHGRSDARGAHPAENPVAPADVVATVYHALGIDPRATLHDAEGRAHRLCEGAPLHELLAGGPASVGVRE
ncbi:MAG: DUF1501 domain-containing protein [Planctomycetes bacterium]|nr:DUF1501 domain-containing protein [Planctomycetota bacterium]